MEVIMSEPTLVEPRGVRVTADGVLLDGDLALPPAPSAVVLFAHGSGSSRRSSRNRSVAAALQQRGLATLLFDLLTFDEACEAGWPAGSGGAGAGTGAGTDAADRRRG